MHSLTNEPALVPPLNPARRRQPSLLADVDSRASIVRTKPPRSDLIADLNTVHNELVAYLNHHSVHLDAASYFYNDADLYLSSPSVVTTASVTPLSVSLESVTSESGGKNRHPDPEPSPLSAPSPSSHPSSEFKSYISSCDNEDMLFAMTVDAAAAVTALASSSSESSRPSSFSSLESTSRSQPAGQHGPGSDKAIMVKVGDDDDQQRLRHLLLSSSKVSKVCLVSPRAGPFEGQFVALITASTVHPPNNETIALLDDLERESGRRQILTFKTALNEWSPDSRRPDVWILLRSMAVNADGEPDARKLQTWVQNLSEDKERKILDMQVIKTARHGANHTPPRPARPDSLVRPLAEVHHHVGEDFIQVGSKDDVTREEYFPLAVMQQLFFRTSLGPNMEAASVTGDDYRFTQSILLRIKVDVELTDLEAAVSVLVSRHSMLRARFQLTNQGWAQVIAPESEPTYRFEHQYVNNDDDLLVCIDDAQRSVNIFTGPVFAAKHIRNAENQQMLYLVAHHLVVDLMSWRILLHDLDEMLREGVLVSEPSMPFTTWTDFKSYENSQRLFEPSLPFEVDPADLGYWGLEEKSNLYGDTTQLTFSLLQKDALSLQRTCNDVFRSESADIFLAALLHSFQQTFQDRGVPTIWKQESGRDAREGNFNVEQTVGWFTALCPISVPVKEGSDVIHLLKTIKDTRKTIPQNGIAFFQSNFAAENSTAASIPVEIMFNCVETLKQLERENGILEPLASPDRRVRSLASDVGPSVGRIALFEVSVAVNDDGARVEFSYNVQSKHKNRIATWMNRFEKSIMEAISRLRVMQPELTLSDVPHLETSYRGLARLAGKRLAEIGISDVRNIETIVPVDPIQHEILIAQAQDATCFRVSKTCELMTPDGSLVDQNMLCDAWETLVADHDILRSIFTDTVSEKGLFDQIILRKTSPAMLFIDSDDPMETLSSLPPMSTSVSQPRHRLSVSRSLHKTFLRIDCSQALCDLIGVANLIEKLRQLYMGKQPFAFERPFLRQNRHIASFDASRSLDLWKASLQGATPCIFPNLAIHGLGRLESQGISLDINRYQLSQFCAESQLSLASVVQLAWAFVVRTYVGKDCVIFGFHHAGRDESLLPDLSRGVGSTAVIAPCMVDFAPVCTVLDALWRLEIRHRDFKTTEIPSLSEIEHSLDVRGQRLFNTCISCQDVYDTVLSDSDSESNIWEPVLVSNSLDANCDLSLCVTLRDNHIQADVSYSCLSPDQLLNVMNTFQRALQIIINTPGQPLSQADLVTEHDFQQIMNPDWEPEQIDTKVPACVHKLIMKQCGARPSAPAVHAWDGDLSYQQVEANVMKLATHLVKLGVGPGMLVAIILERSRWVPVIMLAVMQAGGCFVCLDAQDMAVVEAMIRQLEPQLVVATEGAYKHVSHLIRNYVLINETFLSSLPPQITEFTHQPLPQQAACAFLAPGPEVPKGVFFTHESLCSILSLQGPALKIHSGSRVLQLSAYTIDVSLVEILGTMIHGGCVCIPSALERINDLEGTIARMDVTWTYMTTVLSRKISPSAVPNLQTICFRTRNLDEDAFKPWLGDRDILVAYGAPEVCPLALSVFSIDSESDADIIAPPLLGRFLILNPEDPKKFMPIGAVGELAIDSPIVTPHKYVHGNALVDPTSFESQAGPKKWRYLRTGHRVRHLDRGHIRFLANMREDAVTNGLSALKGLLEKQIRKSLGGDVDVAVESIRTSDTDTARLAAFLEFGDGEFVGPSELDRLTVPMRSKLAAAKWLAETTLTQQATLLNPTKASRSVPELFIPVRRFPLSTSLKINRRKLQKMVSSFSYSELLELSNVPFSGQPYFTGIESKPLPLTQTEEKMRLVWSAVLHILVADIKATDSFFDAGGDKFLATRLALSCRQNGFDVPIKSILNGATLTEICRSLEAGDRQQHHRLTKTPGAAKASPKLNVTHKLPEGADHGFVKLIVAPQLGISWNEVIDVAEASSHQLQCLEPSLYGPRSDIRCLVMRFNGSLGPQRVRAACEALTRLHPTLRTAFVVHDCNLFQVAVDSFHADFIHETMTASALDHSALGVMRRHQLDALQLGMPATKFTFLDAGLQGGRLIVRFSCAQVSETAVPRLVQDFVKLYEQPTAELERTTFFDYTRALRGSRYHDSISHWKRRLEKSKLTQIVPRSRPVPPATEVKSVKEQVKVSSLAEFGVSFESVLKAAWATTLATLSATSDVVFGEVIEGRRLKLETSVDVSSIAGPMETVVPIRVRFPIVNSSPLQVLQLIQKDATESLPFEALGAQKIVHECTNWDNWTKFSTVVRHRSRVPVDGKTTLNIENTTFTYNLVQPLVRDVPDLFVTSTLMAPDRASLSIEYPPARVPDDFAKTALDLLVAAVETMTCYDTISQPILQPSDDYEILEPKTLLEKPGPDVAEPSFTHCLTAEQRDHLQQFLVSTWNEMLSPATQGLPESELLSSRFYDISGSILPAYLFAERLNQDLRKLDIEGIHTVHVTAPQLIAAPTIAAQMALITRNMQSAGFLRGKAGRYKKASGGNKQQHAGPSSKTTAHFSSSNWTLLGKTKGFRRFRHGGGASGSGSGSGSGSHGSMRDYTNRAGDWVKSRVNLSKEKSPIWPMGTARDSPGWEVVAAQDDVGVKDPRGIETVPEAAVEIGTSTVMLAGAGRPCPSPESLNNNSNEDVDIEEDVDDDWTNEVSRALAATGVGAGEAGITSGN